MARRISLREFQEGVVARLKALSTTPSGNSRLGIQVGEENWLVDLTDVSEVVSVPTIVHVPLTQGWFRGVANIRGNLFSVVDLPGFFGGDGVTLGVSSRLLLIHPRHILNSALLVNRMLGLRNLDQMEPLAPDSGALPWSGALWRDEQGRQWRELKLNELVKQTPFLQVGTV
jgi:twitching motility protein PilI